LDVGMKETCYSSPRRFSTWETSSNLQ